MQRPYNIRKYTVGDSHIVCRKYDLFQPDEASIAKMNEVDRLMRLCSGALEGLCSITIREDVRNTSVDALTAMDSLDPSLVRAAYALADEVDLLTPGSLDDVHSIMYPGSDGMSDDSEAFLKEIFDKCFRSNLPMTLMAAYIHNGIIYVNPYGKGDRVMAAMWYSELLGRMFKEFQYISPEAEFMRDRATYDAMAAKPMDLKGFLDFSLDCDREALSRLFGSMW